MKLQYYQVEGKDRFPVDMLRYDECWPMSLDDSGKISNPPALNYKITLCRHATSLRRMPEIKRWRSFGWTVIPDSVTVI